MAIDKLFGNESDCGGCGPVPAAATPPPTTNKQWYQKNGTWWIGDYDSKQPTRGPKGDTGAGVMEYKNTEW